ncbi:hypothetical protein FKE98_05165 [Corynebacterium aurimucosum]|uniref:hypothetical protein n=1 Tax=Corynebacterium guaraldiae TaxID=3051103 RepID=UPI0012B7D2D3|nr:hypothetical protein [Corynebacterium guaraldiae]MTE09841.1 hypothetical protein [Corynebacterium guaraldiae]
MPIVSQPDPGYSPFGFTIPIVDTGASIMGLASNLFSTRFWDVSEANARWGALSGEVAEIVAGLENSAASLEAENDSEATTRAAQKIREVAQAGTHFIANASVMQQKLFGFQAQLMNVQPEAIALAFEVAAIPEPATRQAAEQAALVYMQGVLQQQVISAMPYQHALMDAAPPSGGGDTSTHFGAVMGDGNRYNTDGVTWPKQIAEAIENGTMGPGSFGVADGHIQGLESVGMGADDIARFHNELHNRGRSILSELGFGDALAPINAGEVNTSAANAGLSALDPVRGGAPGSVATTSGAANMPAGVNGLGGLGSGAVGQGLGAIGLADGRGNKLPGGVAGHSGRLPEMSANPTTNAAGFGGAGASFGGPQTGTHPVLGGLPGAVTGTGQQREGRTSLSGGSLVGGGAISTGGTGGVGNAGGAGGVLGAPGGAGSARQGVGSARGAGMRMMPMMGGMARGGEGERRVKSVTTQVERDPNRRDLLGEAPAVLPGVIGDWVREAK